MNNWGAVDGQHCCCCSCCLFVLRSFPLSLFPSSRHDGLVAGIWAETGERCWKVLLQTAHNMALVSGPAASCSITLSLLAMCSHCVNSHGDLSSLDLMHHSMLILRSCAHTTSAISAALHCQTVCIYCACRSSLWCHPGHYLWQCLVGLPLAQYKCLGLNHQPRLLVPGNTLSALWQMLGHLHFLQGDC